jgi:hypothetical protein
MLIKLVIICLVTVLASKLVQVDAGVNQFSSNKSLMESALTYEKSASKHNPMVAKAFERNLLDLTAAVATAACDHCSTQVKPPL